MNEPRPVPDDVASPISGEVAVGPSSETGSVIESSEPATRHSLKVDIVSIFPEYFAVLDLSLMGKAQREGLVDVTTHQLRDYTHDRHRTVDDTPYGGGAGMVMKVEPWAEALRAICLPDDGTKTEVSQPRPHLIIPSPAGIPFSQSHARALAAEPWLVFACGRYEGIDERVVEWSRAGLGATVSLFSLGDYVLNGGEVAVLAMLEAIARLVPGMVGNAESLVEESHEDGLLEYPVYTKPAVWQAAGREYRVPEVLLSGHHGNIESWRHEQRLARTKERRPDLWAAHESA